MGAIGMSVARTDARRGVGRSVVLGVLGLLAAVGILGAIGWRVFWYPGPPIVEYRVAMPGAIPAAIVAAPDGTVWFTLDSSDQLGHVRDGQLSLLPKGERNVEPLGLAVAPDGAVWYTDALADAITRRAPDGTLLPFPLTNPADKL